MKNSKDSGYVSKICSMVHVSESEIDAVFCDYSSEWEDLKLEKALYQLGLNTNLNYEFQSASQHRNRMNKVVTCARWYGVEREDDEWIKSGCASQAVKDKLKNSRMLDDIYRSKGLTVDCVEAAEWKDKYSKGEEQYE